MALRRASSPVAVVALLAANLLPLAGVVWWDWRVFEVLVLYWLESGVVGALNVPKILLARGENEGEGESERPEASPVSVEWGFEELPTEWLARQSATSERVGLAAFFVVHYGVFWVVHGAFVFVLPLFALGGGPFGGGPVGGGGGFAGWSLRTSPAVFLLAAGSLVVSHTVSFVTNYLRAGEYRTVSPHRQMMRPYGRVMVLHLTIVFGAFLVASFGSPLPALVLLVALKTALDLGAHLRDHRGVRPAPGAT